MIPFLLQSGGLNALMNSAQFILPLTNSGSGAVDTGLARGVGTLSSSRASVAWTKLSTGLWAEVASGVLRSSYTGRNTAAGSYIGYWPELAGTQLVTPTASIRDMTDASWVATSVTAAKNATGIDGVANSASTLTATANGGTILQTLVAAASSRTYSVFLRRKTGTGTITLQQGATTLDVTASLNSTTYTSVELTASILDVAFGIIFGTNGDEVEADFNQFEAKATASSPMASAGAARVADVLRFTSTANFGAAGSVYCEATPLIAGNNVILQIDDNTANERIRVYRATNNPALQIIDGGVSQADFTASTLTNGVLAKLAGSWETDKINFAANGTLGTEDTSATTPTTTQVSIGSSPTGSALQWEGGVQNVRIWTPVRSRNDLDLMTT